MMCLTTAIIPIITKNVRLTTCHLQDDAHTSVTSRQTKVSALRKKRKPAMRLFVIYDTYVRTPDKER